MEQVIRESLTGEAQKNALELATFLNESGMSCERSTTGYWADKIYFVCNYNDQSVCYISINEYENNTWYITGDDSNDGWFENVLLDERMKEIAWNHVSVCENETRCFDGCVRTNKKFSAKHLTVFVPLQLNLITQLRQKWTA